jgi:Rrf2 family protein
LAAATNTPPAVLAQALAPLVRAGVLAGQPGPGGGYGLARPAAEVSIHDIVVAIDSEREERCVLHERVCSWTGACPFHAVLADAKERFLEVLRATSLADVIANGLPFPDAEGVA